MKLRLDTHTFLWLMGEPEAEEDPRGFLRRLEGRGGVILNDPGSGLLLTPDT